MAYQLVSSPVFRSIKNKFKVEYTKDFTKFKFNKIKIKIKKVYPKEFKFHTHYLIPWLDNPTLVKTNTFSNLYSPIWSVKKKVALSTKDKF